MRKITYIIAAHNRLHEIAEKGYDTHNDIDDAELDRQINKLQVMGRTPEFGNKPFNIKGLRVRAVRN
jgi:hypothetical protein